MQADAYLKSGTNELKIMEYSTEGLHFGLNVLKTNRVINAPEKLVTTVKSHSAVRGVIEEHDSVVPIIDLAVFLEMRDPDQPYHPNGGRILITEFFGQQNGFFIDKVHYLHTILWEQVFDADDVLGKAGSPYVIGIVRPDKKNNILLLDYEKIIIQLSPEIKENECAKLHECQLAGEKRRVLIAEDSRAVRDMLVAQFSEMGFIIIAAKDGKQAWKLFQEHDDFVLVISDVEMPQLEGLSLTKMIKEVSPETPVIVYSSISDQGMKERARKVGADAHVSKLDIKKLVDEVKILLT